MDSKNPLFYVVKDWNGEEIFLLIVSYYLLLREDCLFTNLFSHVKQADAIMALAGSNGRSWSTTYSPQSNPKVTNSSSDCSLSALEREKGGRKASLYKAEEGA